MFEVFTTADAWISLLTLTAMEIVLGIDNIIFISILVGKLPKEQAERARKIGLVMALVLRILFLFGISWILGLQGKLFTLFGVDFSGKSLILLGGGLFLMAKATHETYDKLEGDHHEDTDKGSGSKKAAASVGFIIGQVVLLDIVFSIDSVLTAVGMVDPKHVIIMVIATIIAVIIMLAFAGAVSDFVNKHPSVKILALSFLIMIGILLVAEGTGAHLNKGYVYFAMAFSFIVELLNMRLRAKQKPVTLHGRVEQATTDAAPTNI